MQGYDFRDVEMTFYYFCLGHLWYFCLQSIHMILTRFGMGWKREPPTSGRKRSVTQVRVHRTSSVSRELGAREPGHV
jgi:hypothetical protein